MAQRTSIGWTDLSSNPIAFRRKDTGKRGWHCIKISPGCAHCYSGVLNIRLGTGLDYSRRSSEQVEPFIVEGELAKLLRLKGPRRVFPFDMTDLFLDLIPTPMIDRCMAVMAYRSDVTFQVLTKRPERMAGYMADPGILDRLWEVFRQAERDRLPGWPVVRASVCPAWPPRNLHLGVSVENQKYADARIPLLVKTPAAVRFLSCEPLLGPLDLGRWMSGLDVSYDEDGRDLGSASGGSDLDWCITGAESGHGARSMDEDWVRSLRDQCVEAGVPFFYKQRLDERGRKVELPELDGRTWDEFPGVVHA